MNKIFKSSVILAAFMALVGTVSAQSRYYHLVGDTVIGRSPIYYYDWWPEVNSQGELPDSAVYSRFYGDLGYYFHTISNDQGNTLKIIGIASALSYVNETDLAHPFEQCDTTMDTTMYYILYAATQTGPVELARVCWTEDYDSHPKRYMVLPQTGSMVQNENFCSNLEVSSFVTSLREYYFTTPIVVRDSFYLGWQYNTRNRSSLEYLSYWVNHEIYYSILQQPQSESYSEECILKIPLRKMMYRNLDQNNSSWSYSMVNKYLTVFPIIEIDTTGVPYDTSLFSCPTPGTPTLISRDRYWVRIEWQDDNNQEWMVSVVPAGGNPDSGRITYSSTTTNVFLSISPDTIYNVYVRGRCQTSMWEGWSDWSDFLVIDSMPQEGIASPIGTKFSLFPNPARGTVTVTTAAQQGTLTIIDLQGREVYTQAIRQSGNQAITVDIRSLPAGTYIVTLLTPQGHSSQKLTVE